MGTWLLKLNQLSINSIMIKKLMSLVQDAFFTICFLMGFIVFVRLKGQPLFNGKTKKELYMLNKAANI